MIDERMGWAHEERLRSAGRNTAQPSPFRENSRFRADYAVSLSHSPARIPRLEDEESIPKHDSVTALIQAPALARLSMLADELREEIDFRVALIEGLDPGSEDCEESLYFQEATKKAREKRLDIIHYVAEEETASNFKQHLDHLEVRIGKLKRRNDVLWCIGEDEKATYLTKRLVHVVALLENLKEQRDALRCFGEHETEWEYDRRLDRLQSTIKDLDEMMRSLRCSFEVESAPSDEATALERISSAHEDMTTTGGSSSPRPFPDDESVPIAAINHPQEIELSPPPDRGFQTAPVVSPVPVEPMSTEKIIDTPKTFICSICRRRFTRRAILKNHKRSHTGEKPFCCSVPGCSQTFAQRSEKTRHEKAQHVEKTFVCGGASIEGLSWGCGKAFSRKDGLLEHHRKTAKGKQCLVERDKVKEAA